jgi:hypothetical protein
MEVFGREIGSNYIASFLAATYLFLGVETANMVSYDARKPEKTTSIEFTAGTFKRKPIIEGIEGMPEHGFPTLGAFLNGKKVPYITYIYENEAKRGNHEPAMTLISTLDNGFNDLRVTSEKKCQRCHSTTIRKYGDYLDRIDM